MSKITPIRPLTWGQEVYAEVTAFLRSPEMANVDNVDDLADRVLARWPAIPRKFFEADIAWKAILDEIERRENRAHGHAAPAAPAHVPFSEANHGSDALPFPEPSISEIYERIALEEAKLPASERVLTRGWGPPLRIAEDTDEGEESS